MIIFTGKMCIFRPFIFNPKGVPLEMNLMHENMVSLLDKTASMCEIPKLYSIFG